VNGTASVTILSADVNVTGEETQLVNTTGTRNVTFTDPTVSDSIEGITFTQGAGEVTVIMYDADPTFISPPNIEQLRHKHIPNNKPDYSTGIKKRQSGMRGTPACNPAQHRVTR
jgi:hypothetical protein